MIVLYRFAVEEPQCDSEDSDDDICSTMDGADANAPDDAMSDTASDNYLLHCAKVGLTNSCFLFTDQHYH